MGISRRQFTVMLLGTAALAGCQQAGPAPVPKTDAKPAEAKPAAPAAAAATQAAPRHSASAPTPPPAAANPAADAKPAPAAKPQQKENLVVAVAGEPNSLDSTNELRNVGVRIPYVFHDTLLRRDFFDGNKLVPSLATAWKRVDDLTLEV